jgi:hypothetical protein
LLLPPGFGEYALRDPRYVGLVNAERSGVRVELLSALVTGSVRGEVVQRRPPTAFMVDVEREDPDNPDPIEIEREAMLILLGAIAAKEGPREGGEDAGGPGTAAGVTPQVAHGGAKDAGGTDQPSEKDGEEAGGEEAGAGGEDPNPEKNPTAEGGGNNGAGEASAGGGGAVTVKRAAETEAVMRAEAMETLKWRWTWSTPPRSSMKGGSAKETPSFGRRR